VWGDRKSFAQPQTDATDPNEASNGSPYLVDMHQRPVRSFGQGAMFTAHSISSGSPTMEICRSMLTAAGLLAFSSISGLAQQATGVPASPEATTTITGKQLPPPDPAFGGVIKEKASESKP
jgi:hypothetical protein